MTAYSTTTIKHELFGEPVNYKRLYIKVDKPHPALRIIHAPNGTAFTFKTSLMNKSGTRAEQQRCAQVMKIKDTKLSDVTVWTTTDVPDVAVLVVGSWNSGEVSTATYNGSNYEWFEDRAADAAKGANNNLTVSYRSLPRDSVIFVCNPLNNSALFDVFISVEFSIFQASSSNTVWVGKKSMSVAANNSKYETIGAQFVFDEPSHKPLKVKVKIGGVQEADGVLITFLVLASVFVVLCIAMVLMVVVPRYGPRLCFRFGYNNYTNIPDK